MLNLRGIYGTRYGKHYLLDVRHRIYLLQELSPQNGIYEGYTYEVRCKVKSDPNTTMKFQLWLHDNVVGNRSSMRTEKVPKAMETPSNEFKEIKTNFIATATNGIRIHLHNKGGLGKIYVREIAVYKVS